MNNEINFERLVSDVNYKKEIWRRFTLTDPVFAKVQREKMLDPMYKNRFYNAFRFKLAKLEEEKEITGKTI